LDEFEHGVFSSCSLSIVVDTRQSAEQRGAVDYSLLGTKPSNDALSQRWESAMFKHILFPTDGSELSGQAIPKTVALAKSMSASVTGLTVSEPFHVFASEPMMVTDTEDAYRARCEKRATQYLNAPKKAAEAVGVAFTGLHVFSDQPYTAIIGTASARGCDLICMASHGRRGVSALVLGSETVKVLTHSRIPVLVWR
jgi:Universal stress protein UspA and related nucleotide-binding proteins